MWCRGVHGRPLWAGGEGQGSRRPRDHLPWPLHGPEPWGKGLVHTLGPPFTRNKVPWSPRFPLGVRYSSTRFTIVCREERKMSFCSMWHFLTFTFGNQRKGLKSQLAQHPAVQPVILLRVHSWVWAGACLPS